jgi:hypothetical protein
MIMDLLQNFPVMVAFFRVDHRALEFQHARVGDLDAACCRRAVAVGPKIPRDQVAQEVAPKQLIMFGARYEPKLPGELRIGLGVIATRVH